MLFYVFLSGEGCTFNIMLNKCFRSYFIISIVCKPEILEEELICSLHLPSLSKFQAMVEKRESKHFKTQKIKDEFNKDFCFLKSHIVTNVVKTLFPSGELCLLTSISRE